MIRQRSLNRGKIQHRLAEQAVDRILLPSLRFDEQRPEFVRLHFVSLHVLLPEFGRTLRVLDDQLTVHDGPDERIRRPDLADARGVTAIAAVSRHIFRRRLLERFAKAPSKYVPAY